MPQPPKAAAGRQAGADTCTEKGSLADSNANLATLLKEMPPLQLALVNISAVLTQFRHIAICGKLLKKKPSRPLLTSLQTVWEAIDR